jgi:hypothetical protein
MDGTGFKAAKAAAEEKLRLLLTNTDGSKDKVLEKSEVEEAKLEVEEAKSYSCHIATVGRLETDSEEDQAATNFVAVTLQSLQRRKIAKKVAQRTLEDKKMRFDGQSPAKDLASKPSELPESWEMFLDDDGTPYFFCEVSGETIWDKPGTRPTISVELKTSAALPEQPVTATLLPEEWEEFLDDGDAPYYYCKASGETLWDKPLPCGMSIAQLQDSRDAGELTHDEYELAAEQITSSAAENVAAVSTAAPDQALTAVQYNEQEAVSSIEQREALTASDHEKSEENRLKAAEKANKETEKMRAKERKMQAEEVRVKVEDVERQRQAKEARLEAEALEKQRQAETARLTVEAVEKQRQAEEARLEVEAVENQRKAEEARLYAEAVEKQRLAEESPLEAEAAKKQRQAEEARLEAEAVEKQRQAEEARLEAEAVEKQRQAEEARSEAEAVEKQRQAEEARLEAEAVEKQRQAEEARLEAEAVEKQRQAEEARL